MLVPPFPLVLPFSFSRKEGCKHQMGEGTPNGNTRMYIYNNNKVENIDGVIDYKVGILWEHQLCCRATQSCYFEEGGKSIWLNCAPTSWTTVGGFLVCSGQPFCIEYSVNQRHKENHVRRTEGKLLFCLFPIFRNVAICSALLWTSQAISPV